MADMCPYCGDDLAPGAINCSRCGMDLDGGGSAPPADTTVAPSPDSADPKPVETKTCPHCDEPIKKSAHRCPACGRGIERLMGADVHADNLKFKLYIYSGLAGTGLLFFAFLLSGGC